MSAAESPSRSLVIFFALIAFAILCGLGTWQVKRLHWKEGLLQSIEERMAASPHSIDEIKALYRKTGDVDYVPVTLAGRFRHDAEQYFFATHRGASGYYIYTPLDLDNGSTVFINRGFVPFDLKDPSRRIEGQTEGEVSVTGLVRNRLDEKPSWAVPENDAASNIYYWKDIEAMAENAGIKSTDDLLPFFIDAADTPNPGGFPVGGVTMVDLPNNHLQYAITWYGLALALAGVVGAWLWGQRKSRQA